MCVATVGQVVEIRGKRAVCSFRGVLREVSISLVPRVKLGDSVVVHAGFVSEIIKDTNNYYHDLVATDALAGQILDAIKRENTKMHHRHVRLMNFCGSHESTVIRYGLRQLLPENIELVSGPGCPVCVVPNEEIEMGIKLAKSDNVILTVHGDMMRVPTGLGSLEEIRAAGADVRIVYDINEAIQIARECSREVVHFAVGFETTAPATAAAILEADGISNFSIISSHRVTSPIIQCVLQNCEVDGVIAPGHVAMITGLKPFAELNKQFKIPFAISGFQPIDILHSVLNILIRINEEKPEVFNQYTRVVNSGGNLEAQKKIEQVFTVQDDYLRGFPKLAKSRLVLNRRWSKFNAEKKFNLRLNEKKRGQPDDSFCGAVLQGAMPHQCPHFGTVCTPVNPLGPCMVSQEGPCYASYHNGTP